MAITSLVLGIGSVFCLGLGFLPGLAAIVTGHVARRRVRREPAGHGGAGLALAGLILGYLSLVQSALVWSSLLGAAKTGTQAAVCQNNLRQIGMAVRLYAEVSQGRYPTATAHFGQHLGYSQLLVCPLDKKLVQQKIAAKDFSQTSYILTLEEASEATPEKVIARCPIHGYTLKANGLVGGLFPTPTNAPAPPQ